MRRFDEDSWRIFRIKAGAPVGFDKVRVEAKNTKMRKALGLVVHRHLVMFAALF